MSKTQDEVAKFLQDLDILTKTNKTVDSVSKKTLVSPSNAANSNAANSNSNAANSNKSDTLNNAPTVVTSTALPNVKSTIPTNVGLSDGTVGPPVGQTDTIGPPPMGKMGQSGQLGQSGIPKKTKKVTHGYVPLAAPVQVDLLSQNIPQESLNTSNTQGYGNAQENDHRQAKSQEWNLASLWNKASQVAESTARVVAGNENVVKMAEKVNTNLNKWAETLAPKIEIKHEKGFLADQLTVWICLEAEKGISRDVLKDFTFSTINDLWLNPVNRICKNVKVYNVDHSENIVANSLQEALNRTEGIVTGLQKLSDEAIEKQYSQMDANQVSLEQIRASVIMVVQQVALPLSCGLLDDPIHTFFLVTLVCDTPELGFISCSSCSQSIVKPVGFLKSKSVWSDWESSQRVRVLETVVGDILEEFIAKVGHIRQNQTTH